MQQRVAYTNLADPAASDQTGRRTRFQIARTRARAAVRRLDPALTTQPESMHAAIIVLGAPMVGQNAGKLARLADCTTDFASRCMRRLYDNGVWTGGASGLPECTDAQALQKLVAVAVGRVRRYESESGEVVWTTPAAWSADLRARAPHEPVQHEVDPEPEPGPVEEPAKPAPVKATSTEWLVTARASEFQPMTLGSRQVLAGSGGKSGAVWLG